MERSIVGESMPKNKVVVFATSFLDDLATHPQNEHTGRALLSSLADRDDNPVEVEFRCDRDPGTPMTASELDGVVAVIADLETYDAELLASVGVNAGGTLELVARYGVGYDAVDVGAAVRSGVTVCNTPGANSVPTAEWSVATLLAIAGRRLPHHERAAAGLTKDGPSRLDVSGKTLGIVGTGAIGRTVASLLSGFNPLIVATDPYPDDRWGKDNGVRYVELRELCREADFITLHAAGSREIIGKEMIEYMKSTTTLVNCARSIFVDNRAAWSAVAEGRLWGYGMDDPWTESDLPLTGLNIVVSPHVGSDTDNGKAAMRELSAKAVVDYLSGRTPAAIVAAPTISVENHDSATE